MTPTEQAKTMSMVERVARILEPQAWAASGLNDTLAYANRRTSSLRKARAVQQSVLAYLRQNPQTFDMGGKSFEFARGFAAGLSAMADRLSDAALSEEGE